MLDNEIAELNRKINVSIHGMNHLFNEEMPDLTKSQFSKEAIVQDLNELSESLFEIYEKMMEIYLQYFPDLEEES